MGYKGGDEMCIFCYITILLPCTIQGTTALCLATALTVWSRRGVKLPPRAYTAATALGAMAWMQVRLTVIVIGYFGACVPILSLEKYFTYMVNINIEKRVLLIRFASPGWFRNFDSHTVCTNGFGCHAPVWFPPYTVLCYLAHT